MKPTYIRRVLLFKARHLAIDEEKDGLFSVDGFESPFVLAKAPSLLFPLCFGNALPVFVLASGEREGV
jgi:hypothetical protein